MSEELAKSSEIMAIAKSPFALQNGQVYSSLDLSSGVGKLAFYKARQSSEDQLKLMVNKPLRIANLLCHYVTDVDETTGELKTWKRWVLITEEGSTISTGSNPVDGDIQTVCYILGMPPWNPSVTLTPILKKSSRNPDRSYIQLQLDEKEILSRMETKGRKK